MPNAYLAYSDGTETIAADEQQTFNEITAAMKRLSVLMNDRYRHAVRSVHSKSHGLLRGELTVADNLPPELAQGMFAKPKSFPVIMRFSTTPGDVLADSISTPRGLAMKVIGVEGEMLPEHAGQVTQDFVMVSGKTFGVPDAKHFLQQQKLIEANANDPEIFKKLVSNLARGTNAVLRLFGGEVGALDQLGYPETHVLGETFGTQAAIRYGAHVAKIAVVPVSKNLLDLTGKHVDVNFHYSGLRDAIVDFFKTETAEWEVQAQLAVDPEKTPIENPAIVWPEELSPYRTVAKITALPQEAFSPARHVFVDEILSFNPWHALAAHRPLGQIMRARKQAYEMSTSFRHEMNGRPRVEPRSIEELPE